LKNARLFSSHFNQIASAERTLVAPYRFSRIYHHAVGVLPAPSDLLIDLKPLAAKGIAVVVIVT
jgi:hypothetical protein